MGRVEYPVHLSRTPKRGGKQPSGLAKPQGIGSRRMGTAPRDLCPDIGSAGNSSGGPLRVRPQPSTAALLHQVPVPQSRGNGRSTCPLAKGSDVRLPSDPHNHEGTQESDSRAGGSHLGGAALAKTPLVLHNSRVCSRKAMVPTATTRPPATGPSVSPRPQLVATERLEVERSDLADRGYTDSVIHTIWASRRTSTQRIYQVTWSAFSKWAFRNGVNPLHAGVPEVLRFLQEGLKLHLHPSTLRRQVSALSSVLNITSKNKHDLHPHITRFLRGATNLAPPVLRRFPTWDLNKVLNALPKPPFEPITTIPLKNLSYKVLFLVAITSARRVSEMGRYHPERNFALFRMTRLS
ncbi:uncharacterized protein LOC128329542 [Hemicordylus capensis]|uniref:uncharacterized protein LOC128329542 n=1 Tax=Hemicordylus capensis TaxID=884348 RepID=UPI00230238B0|nr:uncharacterized protein LOC128329542 [Hemicordylus capensis]